MIPFDPTKPLLVFGGPYSNLEATRAMRHRAEDLAIPANNVICTGDVVAYCAAPEETARLVADWGCHVIQGNCEQQLAAGAEDCACNFEDGTECAALAKGWYPFANSRMSDEMRAWMGDLPTTLRFTFAGRTFRVIHGGTDVINRWVFPSERDILTEEVVLAGADVIIAGHSGIPSITRVRKRVWFNPGVIGMPANDGTADVWYGLIRPIDDGGVMLSTHRLAYDHHTSRRRYAPLRSCQRLRPHSRHRPLAEPRHPPARRARRHRPAHPRAHASDRAAPARASTGSRFECS